MSSLFVYKMQVLPLINEKDIVEIENVMNDFLWKGKKPKIPLKKLQCSKTDGGLGLVDLKAKHQSLLFSWILDCRNNSQISNLCKTSLRYEPDWVWSANLNEHDSKLLFGNTFWGRLASMWHKFNFHTPQNQEKVLLQKIWLNSHLRVNGAPFYVTDAENSSLQLVGDLYDTEMKCFYPYEKVRDKYGAIVTWLEYNALVSAVLREWGYVFRSTDLIDDEVTKYANTLNRQKISKCIYADLIATDETVRACSQTWYKKAGIITTICSFRKEFARIYTLTSLVKLRDFQFRLLHNKIFCNDVLIHWKKVASNACNLCQLEKQDIIHLLYGCEYVKKIYSFLHTQFTSVGLECKINFETVLFNRVIVDEEHHIGNVLILIVKQYVFRCKCQNVLPTIAGTIREFQKIRDIELYNAKITMKYRRVLNKWSPVQEILVNDVNSQTN